MKELDGRVSMFTAKERVAMVRIYAKCLDAPVRIIDKSKTMKMKFPYEKPEPLTDGRYRGRVW